MIAFARLGLLICLIFLASFQNGARGQKLRVPALPELRVLPLPSVLSTEDWSFRSFPIRLELELSFQETEWMSLRKNRSEVMTIVPITWICVTGSIKNVIPVLPK